MPPEFKYSWQEPTFKVGDRLQVNAGRLGLKIGTVTRVMTSYGDCGISTHTYRVRMERVSGRGAILRDFGIGDITSWRPPHPTPEIISMMAAE